MARTDGLMTGDPSPTGLWRYTNVRSGAGPVSDPEQDCYLRVERSSSGAIPGTKVDAKGLVSDGPTISFTSPTGLLAGAPAVPTTSVASLAQAQDNLFIVWAGVSPRSLREVLIVWSTDVVLLNRGKIKQLSGPGTIEAVSLQGRLMVVAMTDPVSIDGEEQYGLSIDSGAVGYYTELTGTDCVVEAEEQIPAESSGELSPLPELPQFECAAGTSVGIAGPGNSGSAGPVSLVTEPLQFCTECLDPDNADDQPQGDLLPQDSPTAAFVSNRAFATVPVRCCYPFCLVNTYVDPVTETCTGIPAPIWLVAMRLYGATVPLQTLPLDQLVDVDPCAIDPLITAELVSDVALCSETTVQVRGQSGPAVEIDAYWCGTLAGYKGQSVLLAYRTGVPLETCGKGTDTCHSYVIPDEGQAWVSEDVIKPAIRRIPIACFTNTGLTITTMVLPSTIMSTTLRFITEISSTTVQVITALQTTVYTSMVTESAPPTTVNLARCASGAKWLLGYGTATLQVCDESGPVTITVITSLDTADIDCDLVRDYTLGTRDVTVVTPLVTPQDIVARIGTEDKDIFLPVGQIEAAIPILSDDPDNPQIMIRTVCPTVETPGILQLLMKPPAITATGAVFTPGFCGPSCTPVTQGLEGPDDPDVYMLAPRMTMKPPGSENSCPCYKCSDTELSRDNPHGAEQAPTGPINPCTVSVKRLQRDWCLRG